MVVQKGSGFYHISAANTNRMVFYTVVATGTTPDGFLFLKGTNAFPPYVGEVSAPTVNQKIGQYRTDYVARFIAPYAIPVYVAIGPTAVYAGDTLILGYETYVSNVFGTTVADITDTLGKADRVAKVKPGLQTIATSLISTASLDGGSTLLFGASPNLSDGTVTTAAAITALTVTRSTLTPQMAGY